MSDSESSQQIEVKVEQQQQAKVRDLIQKGKQITPFYDEDTLYNIYKDSYYNDNVFINKLEIIVKTRRQHEQDSNSDWIYEKAHEKSANTKRSDGDSEVHRERYNFLEDKRLIQRATKYRPENDHKDKEHHIKNNRQFRQRQEPNGGLAEKSKGYNTKFDNSVTIKEKKLKFKEKQPEQVTLAKGQVVESKVSVPAIVNIEKKQRKGPKYEQKKTHNSAYVQKNTKQAHEQCKQIQNHEITAKIEQKIVQIKAPEVKKETKVQYKVKQEPRQQVKAQIKHQTVDIKPVTQQPKATQTTANTTKNNIQKKAEEIKQKASIVVTSAELPSSTLQKNQVKVQSQKRTSGQRQSKLDPEVQKQFQNSLKQNPLILKIIAPSQRLQKVSYIKYPNGSYNEVKVREMAQHH